MMRLLQIIPLLFVLFTAACVPTSPNTNRTTNNTTTGDDDDTGTTPSDLADQVTWFYASAYQASIQVNADIDTKIFLRGKGVDTYLKSDSNFYTSAGKNKEYCAVISYTASGAKKQLRVKTYPITYNTPAAGTTERLFRIDIDNSASTNQTACSGTLDSVNDGDAAFSIDTLCPTCGQVIQSSKVQLFAKDDSFGLIEVPNSSIDFTGIELRIDMGSSTIDPGGNTCSDSSCDAIGKDCCIDNQCVNNGTIRPNASSNPNYAQAQASVAQDPTNITKWTDIYFVCPNFAGEPTTPTVPTQPDPDALLQQDKDNYECLINGVAASPSYDKCTLSPTCSGAGCALADYTFVKNHVYEACGCPVDPNALPPNDQATLCPNWGLALEFAPGTVNGTIDDAIGTKCTIIPDDIDNSPEFTSAIVKVSGRTVPHRFYDDANGLPYDSLTGLVNITQEGVRFFYEDEINKTGPQNGSFNMNSILGQMEIDSTRAIPAQVVNLDLEQDYIIAATNGFYTPCPTCVADQWASSYTAHPNATTGFGVAATNYETNRSEGIGNASRGNYEDTIFGRACWVPPTMLPFSHTPNSDLKTQRRNRLKTQAAMYINGYQRDWFGFNKGAAIGSFDGISWFAIGAGRRVRATSSKLYLAVNSPLGDLSSNTSITISVIKDTGGNEAADYDYDPSLGMFDNTQNYGATCQKYHQCNTDSDCVTQLGWEYSCADVSKYKTDWPNFDIDANEIVNTELSSIGFISSGKILHGFPGGSTKRCVYRGAGAPCKGKYDQDIDSKTAELFTCAPNFYCAKLTSDDFNSEIARTPKFLDVILFGQEADIVGRPLNYISRTSTSFDTVIKDGIRNSAAIHSATTTDWGLCRPAKSLTSNPVLAHQSKDSGKRTDYISQIGSCDSTTIGTSRINTCPALVEDEDSSEYGNYFRSSTDFTLHSKQNTCGMESQNDQGISAFNAIEEAALTGIFIIDQETLVKDACLRKPGAVCHTDLDCSPNRMQAAEAGRYGKTYFGDTFAEQNYWMEELVCGQAKPKPSQLDSTYDMTLNRCCREVGNTLTMYTETTREIAPDIGTDDTKLDVSKFPINNPKAIGRYSRYSVVAPLGGTLATTTPFPEPPVVVPGFDPKRFQWKTINDTAQKTCCGGGWVRKFQDNSNDWSNNRRLMLDTSNFKCLNYENELPFIADDNNYVDFLINKENYSEDDARQCLAPSIDGCTQIPLKKASLFEIVFPSELTSSDYTGTVNTLPVDHSGSIYQDLSNKAPFQPVPAINKVQANDPAINYFGNITYTFVTMRLPLYIGGYRNLNSIQIQFLDNDKNASTPSLVTLKGYPSDASPLCTVSTNPQTGVSPDPIPGGALDPLPKGYYCIDTTTFDYDVLHVRMTPEAADPVHPNYPGTVGPNMGAAAGEWAEAGVIINYNMPNTPSYVYNTAYTAGQKLMMSGMHGGNHMYYSTKLGRLELLGIPQIYYEPIYCNSNRSKLVEGIFESTITDRIGFDNNSFLHDPRSNSTTDKSLAQVYDSKSSGLTYQADISNDLERIVLQDKIAHSSVFKANEFMCCMNLGAETTKSGNCCSGYSEIETVDGVDKRVCKLPTGVDLNVYFNRFVSGDGSGDEQPGGGLVDDDFIPETGEPKLTIAVYDKLKALGEAYCSSGKIRKGGAFGNFYAQPNDGYFEPPAGAPSDDEDNRYFGILDSSRDAEAAQSGSSSEALGGYQAFIDGYKWPHHYYCEKP